MTSTERVQKFRRKMLQEDNEDQFHINETIRREQQRLKYAEKIADENEAVVLREKWKLDKQRQKEQKITRSVENSSVSDASMSTDKFESAFNTKSAYFKALKKANSALPKDNAKADEVMRGLMKRRHLENEENHTNEIPVPRKIVKLGYEDLPTLLSRFFNCDEISKQLPGMKDCVRIDGEKEQKRVMLMSMEQSLESFKEMFPQQNLSYSKLCKERPKNVLKFTEIRHETCICVYCENMDLKFNALKKFLIDPKMNLDAIIPLLVCSTKCFDCMSSSCLQCKDYTIKLKELIAINNYQATVKYSQWIHSEGFLQLTKITDKNLEDMLKNINDNFEHYKLHKFMVQAQFKFLSDTKAKVSKRKAILMMDYSQNYECRTQREASSAYFGCRQVGLFTAAAIIGDDKEQISFAIVNDNLSHDSSQVRVLIFDANSVRYDFNIFRFTVT
jgi:hypothetical protein